MNSSPIYQKDYLLTLKSQPRKRDWAVQSAQNKRILLNTNSANNAYTTFNLYMPHRCNLVIIQFIYESQCRCRGIGYNIALLAGSTPAHDV